MKKLICLVILSACVVGAFAVDEIVALSNGEKIFVKNNGTWDYLYEPPRRPASGASPEFTFRKTKWGMSREEVKITEQFGYQYDSPELVLYDWEILGLPCDLIYNFNQDKLMRAAYNFTKEHADPSRYLADFLSLDRELRSKYGNHTRQVQEWKDPRIKPLAQEWGRSIQRGDLSLLTTFETDATLIALSLKNDNNKILLMVVYSSKEMMNLKKEELRRAAASDL